MTRKSHSGDPLADDVAFERRLRTLVHTAVTESPAAPDLDGVHVRVSPPVHRRPAIRAARFGLVAAAIVAAVGVLMFVGRESSVELQDEAPVAPMLGLPVHLLPRTVPAGWRLIDIAETRYEFEPGIFSERVQLFRRTSDGAALQVTWQPTGGASSGEVQTVTEPSVTEPAVAVSVANPVAAGPARGNIAGGSGTFTLAGTEVGVAAVGLSDADATAIAEQLTIGDDLQWAALPPESGFVDEQRLEPHEVPAQVQGELVYGNDAGSRISIFAYRLFGSDASRLGVPTPIDGVMVYTTTNGGSLYSFNDVVVDAASETDPEIARTMLASMVEVDAAAWRREADAVAARAVGGRPVISGEGTGFKVTVYDGADGRHLCLVAEVSTCHLGFQFTDVSYARGSFRAPVGWVYAELELLGQAGGPDPGSVTLEAVTPKLDARYAGRTDEGLGLMFWQFADDTRNPEVTYSALWEPPSADRLSGRQGLSYPLL